MMQNGHISPPAVYLAQKKLGHGPEGCKSILGGEARHVKSIVVPMFSGTMLNARLHDVTGPVMG